jgi:hypothetical protein
LLGRATGGLLAPFKHVERQALHAAKSFAAAGLAFGSVEGIHRSIETTDSLVKTTVKLRTQFGLTTQSASGLAGVLQARDLQPQGLTMGLTALAKQLIAAEHGSKEAQGAFRIFGIRARDVHQAVGSKDGLASVFQTVVDRMSEMPGGARKAALGQQLLGRASRGLAPLLQEGALGLKQQLKWAKEFGVTLDDHTVGSVEDMVAAQTQAQYAMLGLQIQIGRFAAPLVAKANVALADIVRSFRDGRPEGHKFSKTVYQLGMDLKPVGHGLRVVGGFLKDHPHLLQAAAIAYVGYRLKLLKLLSVAPLAFGKGLLAGRAYKTGFEVGSGGITVPTGPGGGPGGPLGALPKWLGRGLKIGGGVLIAHEIAKHLLHSHNADPLDILNPENAGRTPGEERSHLRAHRGESVHHLAAYYGRHPAMLDRATLDALGMRAAYGPDTGGGHFHIYIDGKQVAHAMVDKHGKVIATGVAKAANDAAARKGR